MKIHRFTGRSAREALARVREALGPDAMILSNRTMGEDVEILACGEGDFDAVLEGGSLPEAIAAASEEAPLRASLPDEAVCSLLLEIRTMRSALESQLAELSWADQQKRFPARVETLKELLAIGLSPSLARYLSSKCPPEQSVDEGLQWAQHTLASNLQVLPDENDLLDAGGIYALVGPTGVGKTTTTAKLAARCVMRHGPGKLALITTDGYRIGAHEQLRIYGKILGVMVHSVKDDVDLRIALDELKSKHTVLIDTVGMSQRDQMVAEQIAMLSDTPLPVKRLLCLNCTSTIDTLNEVVHAYRGSGLSGVILTKLDEAPSVSGALDVVLRQKLKVYYLGTGQRVPEDLQVPSAAELVKRAFSTRGRHTANRYEDAELETVVNAQHVRSDPSVRGIHVA